MTLSEFKAWFEGFSEMMAGPPNEDQWARIKARVSEINDVPTSYPVFVDRYVTPYRRWYDSPIYWGGGYSANSSAATTFNVQSAMANAGRAEYSASLAS